MLICFGAEGWMKSFNRETEKKRNYIFHRIILLGTGVLWHGLGIFSLNLRISWEFLSFVQMMSVQTLPACVLSPLLTAPHTNTYFKFFQSLSSDQMNHVEEPKELQNKRKKPWVRNLISTVRKSDLSPCSSRNTLSDSPKRLPSSPCSPFSSHGRHMCKPSIPSVPRVPAAVLKNQEAPLLPGCRQTLHVPAALSPALRLPGFMPAGAYAGSAKTSITERARHLGHTARLPRSGQLVPALGRWIQIVTNSSQLTLFLRGIMLLSIFGNLTRNWFPGS